MPIKAKLEITLKFTELPPDVTTDKNGWKLFSLDCDGRTFSLALRPRMWNKLEEANKNYPLWVAWITGTMGTQTGTVFKVHEPGVQVFERKPRPVEPTNS